MKAKAISYISVFLLSLGVNTISFADSPPCAGDYTGGTDDCHKILVMDAKLYGNGCSDHFTFSSSNNGYVYCTNSGAKNDRGDPVCSASNTLCSCESSQCS